MKRLLLVEDEEVILKALRRLLERNHYVVETATTVAQAVAAQPRDFDLILADLRLPGDEGTRVIPLADPVPVIIMTSHASVRSAVDAMRHGAIDYIVKPFDHGELLLVIQRALEQNLMQAQNRALRLDVQRTQPCYQQVNSSVIENLLSELQDSRDNRHFLHLHGERGTNREGLARLIHASSKRCDAPFIVADISADTASSDALALLGEQHEDERDPLLPGGLLRAAHNGTLVLRHPEELAPGLQNRLAEMLRQAVPELAGKSRNHSVNIKLITISHEPIEPLVERGLLVQSLAELFVHEQCRVPPLRERRQDILPLAHHLLRALERRHAFHALKLSSEAEAALLANDWPGNVAELDSLLNRAVFVARSPTLTLRDLGIGEWSQQGHDPSLDEYFRFVVLRNQGQLSETELAARLGISRKALWERRQKMALPRNAADAVSDHSAKS